MVDLVGTSNIKYRTGMAAWLERLKEKLLREKRYSRSYYELLELKERIRKKSLRGQEAFA